MHINQENKTVTLDEAKAIDVSKIIENEKRLKKENDSLLSTIKKMHVAIQKLTTENIAGLRTLKIQSDQILSLSNDIKRLSDLQLDNEKDKTATGRLFLQFKYDFNNPFLRSGDIKALYIANKFSYGITLNPLNSQVIYGIEAGIKIF